MSKKNFLLLCLLLLPPLFLPPPLSPSPLPSFSAKLHRKLHYIAPKFPDPFTCNGFADPDPKIAYARVK